MNITLEAIRPDISPAATPDELRVSPIDVLIAAHGLAFAVLAGGTSIGEMLRSLVAIAITITVLLRQHRSNTPLADVGLFAFGLVGLVAGAVVGIHHMIATPGSPLSVSGIAMIGSGLTLVVVGARRLIRRLRGWRKLLAVPIGVIALVAVVMPGALAIFVTNVPDYALGDATPADFGLDYTDVTVTTSDGVDLAGWYVASSNGAAIIQLGGCCAARDDELEYTALLARHGYGVLVLDQRGHGGSEGDGMLWGWWGELDVTAGVDFVLEQPDVVDARVGAIGMSVGGEQVISAAGVDPRIRAVVAEGVSARGARDEGDRASGAGGIFIRYIDWVTKHSAAMITSADMPTPMRDSIAAMTAEQRVLIINTETEAPEVAAAELFESVNPSIVHTWIVPGSTHIGALDTHPEEWERRVFEFLDESL